MGKELGKRPFGSLARAARAVAIIRKAIDVIDRDRAQRKEKLTYSAPRTSRHVSNLFRG